MKQNSQENPTLTFFTPTYNRAYLLPRCYECLCNQESYDFKWLIIDDGSEDNTREIAEEWVKNEKRFKIQYVYKENGGMYTAYNLALEIVDTPLIACFESDDVFEPQAITVIQKNWEIIKNTNLVGFFAPCKDMQGNIIGRLYPDDIKTVYFYKHRKIVDGDKQYVHKTEMLKKVAPMPIFPGEKHFNPSYIFRLLDQYGPLGVSNEVFVKVDYQPDGMTANVIKQYYNSPNSFSELRKLYMQEPDATVKWLMRHNIHYVAECALAHKLNKAVAESPKPFYTILAYPFGVMLAIYIIFKNKKS